MEVINADVRAYLLADPERLILSKAVHYLVTRARIQEPIGACEYLTAMQVSRDNSEAEDLFERRVELSVSQMVLYALIFAREYQASQSPPFSTAREQELYRLVNARMFPVDAPALGERPEFFSPAIFVGESQEHDWFNGCCDFEDLQMNYRLALALCRYVPDGWQQLGMREQPAPPLGAVGWTLFMYACAVHESPLRFLPRAFDLISYKTKNIWLDCPPGARFGYDWTGESVARLTTDRLQATEILGCQDMLATWLEADPENILTAVRIWNIAAAQEQKENGKLERGDVAPDTGRADVPYA